MARFRTFIAVDLSDAIKDNLTALQEELGRDAHGVKWTQVHNMHLTLLFLGDVDQLEVVEICRVVQARSRRHKQFTLQAEGLGAFPNMRRPKILWAGITAGKDELRALHADLEDGLLELGCYRREDREYTPHLTLGRLSHDDRSEDWAKILATQAHWQGGTTSVDEVLIMSSELRRDGPEYSVMGRAHLRSEPEA
jgi:RNA 2',3'-cyclic 3'-phosphodiesterase